MASHGHFETLRARNIRGRVRARTHHRSEMFRELNLRSRRRLRGKACPGASASGGHGLSELGSVMAVTMAASHTQSLSHEVLAQAPHSLCSIAHKSRIRHCEVIRHAQGWPRKAAPSRHSAAASCATCTVEPSELPETASNPKCLHRCKF